MTYELRTRRRFLRDVAAGGAVLTIAACAPAPSVNPSASAAQAKPKRGGTLTLGNAFDLATTDPTTGSGGNTTFFLYQIYDRLVTAGPDIKVRPQLAERWEVGADQKSITFFLRKGVTYQDGTPFDGESVRWNMDRHLTHPKTVHKGTLSALDHVEVIDASTVKFVLKEVYSPFLAQLATGPANMASRKEVESQGDAFGTQLHKAGSGPFMLKEIVKGDHITLARNPNWWGKDQFGTQLPYLDELVIRVLPDSSVRFTNLRTGTVQAAYDVAGPDIALAEQEPSLSVQTTPASGFLFMLANHKPGMVFSDSRLLKAVNMAIDRAELIKVAHAGRGTPAYGPIVPQLFAFDPAFKPYEKPDVEGAKKLVTSVGKGPLSFEILYASGDPALLQALQLIQSQLKKADITATLRGAPSAQVSSEFAAGSFPGVYGITTIGNNQLDPDVALTSVLDLGGRNNTGKYQNAEIQKLLVEERQTFDDAKRKTAMRKIEQIGVVDDPAHVFLLFPQSYMVTTKDVKGLAPNPAGRPTFENAWIDR